MSANNIYESIEGKTFQSLLLEPIKNWRNKAPTHGRVFICGAVLALSSLVGIVDTIGSLALAILTSPLALVGGKLPKAFLKRSGWAFFMIFVENALYQSHNIKLYKITGGSAKPAKNPEDFRKNHPKLMTWSLNPKTSD